jgi:transposase-like protein
MDFKKFTSLTQLLKHYSDETVCRAYLVKQRWEDGKPKCPYCGWDKVYNIEGGKRYKCANNTCYKKFSVTVGTIFESSNIPLNLWFAAVYLSSAHKKGISSLQLGRDIGVSQKTAWFMLHRIRKAFSTHAPNMLHDIVQVDETYVGGKNKNRHSDKKKDGGQGGSGKTIVMGLMQKHGKVMNFIIPDIHSATLLPIIKDNVSKGAIVVTDELRGYAPMSSDYKHVSVNHGGNEYVRGAFDTNSMEGYWSLLKRGLLGIYHSVSPKHLHRYCDEFSYRFNSRGMMDNERFILTLQKVEGRLKYADLIRK